MGNVIGYTRDAGFFDAQWTSGSLSPRFYPGWKKLRDGTSKQVTFIELYTDNGLTKFIDEVVDSPNSAEKDWKRKYPEHWKLYQEGHKTQVIGIPIEDMFLNQPERAEYYKRANILTVEQLMNTSDSNVSGLGLGALQDRENAKKYYELRKEGALFDTLRKEKEILEAQSKANEERVLEQNKKIEELTNLVASLAKSQESEKPKKKK